MSYTDFIYRGSQSLINGVVEPSYWIANNAHANGSIYGLNSAGSMTTTNGAFSGPMCPKLHTSYSGTQIPENDSQTGATIGGKFARFFPFSGSNGGFNHDGGDRRFIAGGFVKSSAGGSSYPVTATPGEGTFISYSLRAFLRLDGANSVTSGAFIGLTAKARVSDNDSTRFVHSNSTSASNSDIQQAPQFCWSGYSVQLATHKAIGVSRSSPSGAGINGVPVLRFVAPEKNDPDDEGANKFYTEDSSTTLAWSTWYHVRLDVVPYADKDVCKVYTAPVTGAGSAAANGIGKEVWTEHISVDIDSTDSYYVPWGGNSDQFSWAGYTFGVSSYGSTDTVPAPDVSIDRFQFLTKDVSS